MYSDIKGTVFAAVPFGTDATHILLGYALFLITLVVFRRPLRSWPAVIPVLLVGAGMEVADLIRGQYWGQAAWDFVLFCLLPLVTVGIYRMGWAK